LITNQSDHVKLETGPSCFAPAANVAEKEVSRLAMLAHENNLRLPFGYRDHTNSFLVATQPGLAAIYDTNGLTQLYAFKASNSDPNTLSYNEAMADVDQELWIAAAKREIKSLEEHGTWTEADASEATS
jgi:hypothetical protein